MTVYLIGDDTRVKIGVAKDPVKRLKNIRTACPFRVRLLREMPGDRPQERWLHWAYRDHHLDGEWFRFCPTMLTVEVPADPTVPQWFGRPRGPGRPRKIGGRPVHVTLETAVLEEIRRECEREGLGLSQLINRVLKAELAA